MPETDPLTRVTAGTLRDMAVNSGLSIGDAERVFAAAARMVPFGYQVWSVRKDHPEAMIALVDHVIHGQVLTREEAFAFKRVLEAQVIGELPKKYEWGYRIVGLIEVPDE